jgi:hypothetical protein
MDWQAENWAWTTRTIFAKTHNVLVLVVLEQVEEVVLFVGIL